MHVLVNQKEIRGDEIDYILDKYPLEFNGGVRTSSLNGQNSLKIFFETPTTLTLEATNPGSLCLLGVGTGSGQGIIIHTFDFITHNSLMKIVK